MVGRVRFIVLALLASLAVLLPAAGASAHSGGTDANGCHAGSRPYHCHGTPPSARYRDSSGMITCRDGTRTTQVGSGTCSGHGGIDTSRGGSGTISPPTSQVTLPRPTRPAAVLTTSSGAPLEVAGTKVTCRLAHALGLDVLVEADLLLTYLQDCLGDPEPTPQAAPRTTSTSAASSRASRMASAARASSSDQDGHSGLLVLAGVVGLGWWWTRD